MNRVSAIIVIAFVAGFFALAFGVNETYLRRPAANSVPAAFVVEQGTGVKRIAADLKDAGIIRSTFTFETYVWLTRTEKKFQAGKFDIIPGLPYGKIVAELTSRGETEREITILEGWGIREIGEYLEREGIAARDEFEAVVGTPAVDYRADLRARRPMDFSSEFPFLEGKPAYVSLEGYLFPDTYRIRIDADAEDVVRIMLRNFGRRVTPELRAELEGRNRTLFEIVTMASIIEREVRTDADRALVSDVLWRRLEAGIALQVDSSVNYVTGKKTPSISFTDRDLDSPFNTYQYPGLPLGPIGNPGLASIIAAIRPEPNESWYFLAGTDGRIHYGRSLEEHSENRVKYLR